MFYWLGIFIKIRAVMAFIGTCIVTGGLFGEILTWIVVHVSDLLGSVAGKAFGVALPGLGVIVLAVIWLHDLHPKKSAKGRTFWIGIALAACLVAGLSSWTALNHIPANVRNGVGTATTIGG